MVDFRSTLLAMCTLAFTVPFVMVSYNQFSRYVAHEVDVNIANVPEYPDLRFPAFSICISHYNYSAFVSDLKVSRAATGLPIRAETGSMYTVLDRLDLLDNLTSYMWKFYFTLDKVLHRDVGCSIGGVSCINSYEVSWPKQDNEAFKVEVAAGEWTSRFLSDGQDGLNVLCHTLVTNRSLDFRVQNGNALILKWTRQFQSWVPHWQVYVHDSEESVVLGTYAISSLSYLSFKKGVEVTDANCKAKARLLPEVYVKAGTSHHPCNDSADYSANQCDIDYCWNRRAQSLKETYGHRFTCVLPGVVAGVKDTDVNYPICNISTQTSLNSSLGLLDLITYERSRVLVSPPLGVELMGGSGCLRRCKTFAYDLRVEDVDVETDPVLKTNDVHIYFPSTFAQVWTERETYTIVSLLSEVGGSLGLFLGLSLLSVVEVVCKIKEMVSFCVGRARKRNTSAARKLQEEKKKKVLE